MSDPVYIPVVKIQPKYIVQYYERHPAWRRRETHLSVRKMPDKKSPDGIMSDRSIKKMTNRINWMLHFTKNKEVYSNHRKCKFTFKLNFITLTLASKQVHPDNEIKSKLLNQFLVEARKRWNVKNYIWRAEAQQNGNIHFHVVTDTFIPWHELRDVWNRIQNKLGYVDRYRTEMKKFFSGGFKVRQELLKKWSYKNQLRAYRTGSKQDWLSPNSVDIHSLFHVKNAGAYMSKYMAKNKPARLIEGRIWGLSYELSNVTGACDCVDAQISQELAKLTQIFADKTIVKEYFTLFCVDVDCLNPDEFPGLYALFYNYVQEYRQKQSHQYHIL
jgi:hypothetical protein